MLKTGVDPTVRGPSGKQPIHMAAAHSAPAIISLVTAGCDVNAVEHAHGNTPLHIACTQFCEEAVFSLIYCGAKINKENNLGETPLLKLLKFAQNRHNSHSTARLKLARILIKIGFSMKGQSERVSTLPVVRRSGRDKIGDMYKSLIRSCGVSPLLHLCRLAVRENMDGVRFCENLEMLELPHTLKSYVTFCHEFSDT